MGSDRTRCNRSKCRDLKAQLTELSDEMSSKSALGKAVSYTLNRERGETYLARRAITTLKAVMLHECLLQRAECDELL